MPAIIVVPAGAAIGWSTIKRSLKEFASIRETRLFISSASMRFAQCLPKDKGRTAAERAAYIFSGYRFYSSSLFVSAARRLAAGARMTGAGSAAAIIARTSVPASIAETGTEAE